MKKSVNPVSPFLLMIVPVLVFVGLSLSFKDKAKAAIQDELSTTTRISTSKMVKVGEQSFIRFLLKK